MMYRHEIFMTPTVKYDCKILEHNVPISTVPLYLLVAFFGFLFDLFEIPTEANLIKKSFVNLVVSCYIATYVLKWFSIIPIIR